MKSLVTAPDGLPELTLGWDVIAWCQTWLQQPDGPNAGGEWRFTDEQMKFLAWWYAVDDDGSFVFRRGVLRRAKGWGKDPLSAVLGIAELLGPCRFADFVDGEARGKPHPAPWVQIGATSLEQTRTTTSLLPSLLPKGTRRAYRMEVMKQLVYAQVGDARGRLEAVSNSFRGQEGSRTTMFIMNETQHWLQSNHGHDMAAVVRRNLAKSRDGSARALALTNAHGPGEDSQAERDYEAWAQQQRPEYANAKDILYDSVEPIVSDDFSLDDRDALVEAMRIAYGDASWVDLNRLAAEHDDPDVSDGEVHRFYLNRVVAGLGQWMDPAVWDAAYDPNFVPEANALIALGFDGSKTRDATGLIATELRSGAQWPVAVWQRDWLEPAWEVPTHEVHEAVERVFDEFRVVRFYCDPPYWEDEVAAWCGRWPGVAAAWYTSGRNAVRVARALHAFRSAVADGAATHGGPLEFLYRRHILNAIERRIGGRAGAEDDLVTIGKKTKDSRDVIDLAMAGMLSWQARLDAIAAGALKDEVTLKLWLPADVGLGGQR